MESTCSSLCADKILCFKANPSLFLLHVIFENELNNRNVDYFRSARTLIEPLMFVPSCPQQFFLVYDIFLLHSSSPPHKSIFFLKIFSSFSFSVFLLSRKKIFSFHTWDLSWPAVTEILSLCRNFSRKRCKNLCTARVIYALST